ncbi:hypothetical protein V5O48_011441 [Marasmius crinis-equi]|uniref:Uncharacterized protein n=1 Tax=Marasmius crinis-equi TaxID=585013 RepID=A0ABR3F5L9_9AGAR
MTASHTAYFSNGFEEVTARLQETRERWTHKIDVLFLVSGVGAMTLTWIAVLIMDPRQTLAATTSVPPTPLEIFLPTILLGLGILSALRGVALRHINDRLFAGFTIVATDDAAILHCRDLSFFPSTTIKDNVIPYPFNVFQAVWETLCIQYSLVCVAELIVAAIYACTKCSQVTPTNSDKKLGDTEAMGLLGRLALFALAVAACVLMVRWICLLWKRIRAALTVKIVCEPYWLAMGLNVEEMHMLCESGV